MEASDVHQVSRFVVVTGTTSVEERDLLASLRKEKMNMKRSTRLRTVAVAALMGLLAVGLASAVSAAEQSSCLTCHLYEAMLVKNRSVATPKVSAMQSGSG
jgi:hypothetical protein